eukprot:1550041-Ditylum_brightwellii.AAC.1
MLDYVGTGLLPYSVGKAVKKAKEYIQNDRHSNMMSSCLCLLLSDRRRTRKKASSTCPIIGCGSKPFKIGVDGFVSPPIKLFRVTSRLCAYLDLMHD